MCQLCHYNLSLEQRHHQSQLKGLPRQVDNVQDVTLHRAWRVWTEQKEQPLNSNKSKIIQTTKIAPCVLVLICPINDQTITSTQLWRLNC